MRCHNGRSGTRDIRDRGNKSSDSRSNNSSSSYNNNKLDRASMRAISKDGSNSLKSTRCSKVGTWANLSKTRITRPYTLQ